MDTWRDRHPAWDYHLWGEQELEAFGLRNQHLFERLLAARVYDAASDVARVELLRGFGGVYIDADSVCRHSLEGAPFLAAPFFATREIPPSGRYLVTNAFMGSEPHHPLLDRYIEHISRARVTCRHGDGAAFCCAWRITGPMALTNLIRRDRTAMVLEPAAFFTRTIKGDPVEGEHYGEHFWSSTGERSPEGWFPGAVSYQEAM